MTQTNHGKYGSYKSRPEGLEAKNGLTLSRAMKLLGQMQDALNERDYGTANAIRDEMLSRFLVEAQIQLKSKTELMEIAQIVEMTDTLEPLRG